MSPSPELDARGGQRHAWRPGVTLPLCFVAVLLHVVPGTPELLEFDRGAIVSGQLWRLLTCHYVHWNLSHLGWDVAALAVLGWICERRGRWTAWLTLSVAAKLIPLAVWLLQPELTAYRGLSGLDAALFALLGADLLRERRAAGWRGWGPPALALLALGAKVAYELVAGAAVFADGGGTFVPVPLAHLVGGLTGAVIGWFDVNRWANSRYMLAEKRQTRALPASPTRAFRSFLRCSSKAAVRRLCGAIGASEG